MNGVVQSEAWTNLKEEYNVLKVIIRVKVVGVGDEQAKLDRSVDIYMYTYILGKAFRVEKTSRRCAQLGEDLFGVI